MEYKRFREIVAKEIGCELEGRANSPSYKYLYEQGIKNIFDELDKTNLTEEQARICAIAYRNGLRTERDVWDEMRKERQRITGERHPFPGLF